MKRVQLKYSKKRSPFWPALCALTLNGLSLHLIIFKCKKTPSTFVIEVLFTSSGDLLLMTSMNGDHNMNSVIGLSLIHI